MKIPWKTTARIPGVLLLPFVALIPLSLVMAIPILAPAGTGPGWDDGSVQGHSQLIERLSTHQEVRVLEGSIALLPSGSGPGNVLFLFPTYRPATEAENQRLSDFVEQGGRLVAATGGGHGASWTEPLGVRFQGLPALSADSENETCLRAPVSTGATSYPLCMKGPSSFPNTTHLLTHQEVDYSSIGRSTRPAFIDTNQDGRLSLGDQGPERVPLVLQWSFGQGDVVAIGDGTVWQNRVVDDHPENLEVAVALVESTGPDGAVYFDSTSSEPRDRMNAVSRPVYAGMSVPERLQWIALVIVAVGLAGGAFYAQRATPWRPHRPMKDAEDPEIERKARALFFGTGAPGSSLGSDPPADPSQRDGSTKTRAPANPNDRSRKTPTRNNDRQRRGR